MLLQAAQNARLSAMDRIAAVLREAILLAGSVREAAAGGRTEEVARLTVEQQRLAVELQKASGELARLAPVTGPDEEEAWPALAERRDRIEELATGLCLLQSANDRLFVELESCLARFLACIDSVKPGRSYDSGGVTAAPVEENRWSFSV